MCFKSSYGLIQNELINNNKYNSFIEMRIIIVYNATICSCLNKPVIQLSLLVNKPAYNKALGGCPRMKVVARESQFEADFVQI
ncbi:hypothetical protein MNBD_GAMMA07-1138 [hydrothermal vent metagenome]|uniref:Uncharacterized protein n=1 Tax=hydrothermal vent metagenome TaxID=652676 RepID=A0A3B0WMK3_9ZZZZ